jgi:hypothetical protein
MAPTAKSAMCTPAAANTLVQIDADGDKHSDYQITPVGSHNLQAGDFVLGHGIDHLIDTSKPGSLRSRRELFFSGYRTVNSVNRVA